METIKKQPQAHLFICCRQRNGDDCCADKGAEKILDDLKKWVKSKGLNQQVKVSRSSCLGYCKTGVTACLYPENKWFHKITPSDLPKIKKMLENCAN